MAYAKDQLKTGYQGQFVIHDHQAKTRHWDFRLEFPTTGETKKVLRSWAIPKHKAPTGGKPVLAQETEDHNLEYGKFEGEIPEGQYGAGNVKIYDKGNFELVEADYDKKYIFKLNGKKVDGYYALIKTDGKKFLWNNVKDISKYKKSSKFVSVVKPQHSFLKSGRDYGEYCTDQIEENALELYLIGKLDVDCKRLKQRIEDRNPHTKIFQESIVKTASKKYQYINHETIVNEIVKSNLQPLRERRDYGREDFIEKQIKELKKEDKLPKDLEKQFKKRLK